MILFICSSLALFLISLWQIEEIWRSIQNNWAYHLPFGFESFNYWGWHDLWFVILGISWGLMFLLVVTYEIT